VFAPAVTTREWPAVRRKLVVDAVVPAPTPRLKKASLAPVFSISTVGSAVGSAMFDAVVETVRVA
jgi:hypothetical protein